MFTDTNSPPSIAVLADGFDARLLGRAAALARELNLRFIHLPSSSVSSNNDSEYSHSIASGDAHDAAARTSGSNPKSKIQNPKSTHAQSTSTATGHGPAFDALLAVTPDRLELRFPNRGDPRPLYVDFVHGPLGYARRAGGERLLFQAIGCRSGRPSVLDATSGLGRDLFAMAHHGCRAVGVERSPVLYALLRDGLDRAALEPDIRRRIPDPIRLILADARDVLRAIRSSNDTVGPSTARTSDTSDLRARLASTDPSDVIYLDPMYPAMPKSALVMIEMRILRRLVGDDTDSAELLDLARSAARKRVVVKRHRHAPPLAPGPDYSVGDKTTRFDVYLT